ncbi:hypothetical protein M2390_002606 [Mycetocola sp. BIGb0189]|uniref:hypothetical protein n=1 Tax=Mycetocola sp. BIGb0189 TaxID=2940604 RepID=UPI00216A4BE8|nr:hypothetical protein [Mycetocola sp. BIGb0189]MCS4277400.1 hypothetical protein [Mycetocola sp. BIGb0189]
METNKADKSGGVKYLTPDQVTELLPGITKQYLADMRYMRKGPAYFKPSYKVVLYREDVIHKWVASTLRSTSEWPSQRKNPVLEHRASKTP